ncbi:MAG TPA: hypothetical protein VGD10_08205 [Allosphingosinicella sp.]|uniref:hypothetical protein n=1 Tax=Allosphingosinicella sp. TaxID=2823234 RepID=UPI002ED9A71B
MSTRKLDEAVVWLKETRRRLGWSTTETARRAREVARFFLDQNKLTQQSISYFENNKAKSIPRWLRYVEIATRVVHLQGEEREDKIAEYAMAALNPHGAREELIEPEEQAVLNAYRSLSDADRHVILQKLASLLPTPTIHNPKSTYKPPPPLKWE